MKKFLSTKEVAQFIGINEKMVYTLVAEKGLPATKVTGKWLFPRHLVEQWIETNTINYPEAVLQESLPSGLLIIAGSNDLLLERSITLFNSLHTDHMAVFGNLGSMGGLRALRRNQCHIASSHLLQDNENEYNFEFANQELDRAPVVVNFCRREQGILIHPDNSKSLHRFEDLASPGIRILNRPLGTGTRLLFDRELKKAGINPEQLDGYRTEIHRHLDVGLEILAGRADAGPGIRPVAALLNLHFIPIRWERYDLLVSKERFFDKTIQLFMGLLHEPEFLKLSDTLDGYDLKTSGRMVFPKD